MTGLLAVWRRGRNAPDAALDATPEEEGAGGGPDAAGRSTTVEAGERSAGERSAGRQEAPAAGGVEGVVGRVWAGLRTAAGRAGHGAGEIHPAASPAAAEAGPGAVTPATRGGRRGAEAARGRARAGSPATEAAAASRESPASAAAGAWYVEDAAAQVARGAFDGAAIRMRQARRRGVGRPGTDATLARRADVLDVAVALGLECEGDAVHVLRRWSEGAGRDDPRAVGELVTLVAEAPAASPRVDEALASALARVGAFAEGIEALRRGQARAEAARDEEAALRIRAALRTLGIGGGEGAERAVGRRASATSAGTVTAAEGPAAEGAAEAGVRPAGVEAAGGDAAATAGARHEAAATDANAVAIVSAHQTGGREPAGAEEEASREEASREEAAARPPVAAPARSPLAWGAVERAVPVAAGRDTDGRNAGAREAGARARVEAPLGGPLGAPASDEEPGGGERQDAALEALIASRLRRLGDVGEGRDAGA